MHMQVNDSPTCRKSHTNFKTIRKSPKIEVPLQIIYFNKDVSRINHPLIGTAHVFRKPQYDVHQDPTPMIAITSIMAPSHGKWDSEDGNGFIMVYHSMVFPNQYDLWW